MSKILLKSVLVCGAMSLLAVDAYAQANHNTVRASKKRVAPPAETIDATVDVKPATASTSDLIGHVTLVRVAGKGDGKPGPNTPITKALDPGGTFVSNCAFLAAPQGYSIGVTVRDFAPNGGLKTDVVASSMTPWIFAGSTMGAPVGQPGSNFDAGPTTRLAQPLGMQTAGNGGVHPLGGYAKSTSGTVITGNVYHIRAQSAGTPYTGGSKSTQLPGGAATNFGTASCSTAMLNSAIAALNSATSGDDIPVISVASQAYNDTGYSGGMGNGGGPDTDWAGDLYEAYYAIAGEPGFHWEETGTSPPGGGTSVDNAATAAPADLATPDAEPTKIDERRERTRPKPRYQRR